MDWQPGDIAACYGAEPVSRAISAATTWPLAPPGLRLGPSHVALISQRGLLVPAAGEPAWVESTSLCQRPCLLRGRPVAGCQVHLPSERVADYERGGGRVVRFRPHPLWRFQGREHSDLWAVLTNFVRNETAYDTRGALLSRSHVLQHLSCLAGQPLTTLFCSELIAAVLQRFGRLCSSHHPGKFHPAKLLRWLVRMGVYQRVDPPRLRVFDPLCEERGAGPAQASTHTPHGTPGAAAPAAHTTGETAG